MNRGAGGACLREEATEALQPRCPSLKRPRSQGNKEEKSAGMRRISRVGQIIPLMVLLAELLVLHLFTAVFCVGDATLAEMERAVEDFSVVAVTKVGFCGSLS